MKLHRPISLILLPLAIVVAAAVGWLIFPKAILRRIHSDMERGEIAPYVVYYGGIVLALVGLCKVVGIAQ